MRTTWSGTTYSANDLRPDIADIDPATIRNEKDFDKIEGMIARLHKKELNDAGKQYEKKIIAINDQKNDARHALDKAFNKRKKAIAKYAVNKHRAELDMMEDEIADLTVADVESMPIVAKTYNAFYQKHAVRPYQKKSAQIEVAYEEAIEQLKSTYTEIHERHSRENLAYWDWREDVIKDKRIAKRAARKSQ